MQVGNLKDPKLTRRIARTGALALLLGLCASAHARSTHTDTWARDKFAGAEKLRDALAGHPKSERTRQEYQRVIDAYRRVYLGCPTCTKADPSVVASADLLLQMGRQFDEASIFRAAIKQYQFLRREYPGSKSRTQALFSIGDIYRRDLNEPSQARVTFQEFLKRYPKSPLADDAQAALSALDEVSHKERSDEGINVKTATAVAKDAEKRKDEVTEPSAYNRVTGVLHWSTADSARVSIDLEREVQFTSERLKHPSRIYFDLRDTKLAAGLAGKTFDVQGALLKKIRVSQFQQGRSRVVLEVDPQSDYKAVLVPNPNRLIIDIHGSAGANVAAAAKKTPNRLIMQGPQPIEVPSERALVQPAAAEMSAGR